MFFLLFCISVISARPNNVSLYNPPTTNSPCAFYEVETRPPPSTCSPSKCAPCPALPTCTENLIFSLDDCRSRFKRLCQPMANQDVRQNTVVIGSNQFYSMCTTDYCAGKYTIQCLPTARVRRSLAPSLDDNTIPKRKFNDGETRNTTIRTAGPTLRIPVLRVIERVLGQTPQRTPIAPVLIETGLAATAVAIDSAIGTTAGEIPIKSAKRPLEDPESTQPAKKQKKTVSFDTEERVVTFDSSEPSSNVRPPQRRMYICEICDEHVTGLDAFLQHLSAKHNALPQTMPDTSESIRLVKPKSEN